MLKFDSHRFRPLKRLAPLSGLFISCLATWLPYTLALPKCHPLAILQVFLEEKYDHVMSLLKILQCVPRVLTVDALPRLLCCSFCPEHPIATLSPLKPTNPTHLSEACLYVTSLPVQTARLCPPGPHSVFYRHLPYYYNYLIHYSY